MNFMKESENIFDYVILGGGISGLSFGNLLARNTDKKFLIIEKEKEAGGLCRSIKIGENYFDIGGGHFLHTKHPEVYDFVFSFVPQENFEKHERKTKIEIHDTFIDFPIENNIWQLPKEKQLLYISSLIDSIEDNQNTEPTNFKQWIVNNLGSEIAENYLIPYNLKIWGVDVDEMGTDWLYKIPRLKIKEILKSIIFNQPVGGKLPSHDYFYYPKKGGFQVIIDSMFSSIKDHVCLGTSVNQLFYDEHQKIWLINGEFKAKRVINTLPWTVLTDWLLHPDIKNLQHNSIVVSMRNFNYMNDWHWCYLPNMMVPEHRIFYMNNYCNANDPNVVFNETNLKRWVDDGENIHYHINEFAYPVPTIDRIRSIENVISHYSEMEMYGLGRWGQWSYHNSDVCIHESIKLFNKLENF